MSDQTEIGFGRRASGEQAAQRLDESDIAEFGVARLALGPGDQILEAQRAAQDSGHIGD